MTKRQRRPLPDFPSEIEVERKNLDGHERWKAVYGLRGIEEKWARALLGASDDNEDIHAVAKRVAQSTAISPDVRLEAEAHLANASDWQQEIGSYATSGAEGMMSMGELRELQLARAWLSVGMGTKAERQAKALVDDVASDPNGLAKRHAADLSELGTLLAPRKK